MVGDPNAMCQASAQAPDGQNMRITQVWIITTDSLCIIYIYIGEWCIMMGIKNILA